VDERAFQALVERQIAEGSHALVPCGTTGESVTLSLREHVRVVELCVEAAAKKVPVIAGAGSNNTAHAIELAEHAKAAGADAVLVVAPYYNRPSQDGMVAHVKAINDAVDIPIYVYNVPGRTVVDMSVQTVGKMAQLRNVVGIKDASGDLGRVAWHRQLAGEKFIQLSGDDPNAIGFNAQGGRGCISVTANVAPDLCATFFNAAMNGDWKTALYWQDRLIRLHKALFTDASPAPTKFAMAQLGLCSDETRLPIAPCSEAARAEVLAAMKVAGIA
jgi:4-hydroxy-tetrahydrodipicolinate synthase